MNCIDEAVEKAQREVIQKALQRGDEVVLLPSTYGHPIIITISKKKEP